MSIWMVIEIIVEMMINCNNMNICIGFDFFDLRGFRFGFI